MRNQGEGFPTFPSPSTFHLFNPSLSLSNPFFEPALLFNPSLSLQPLLRTSTLSNQHGHATLFERPCSLFSLTLQWSTCKSLRIPVLRCPLFSNASAAVPPLHSSLVPRCPLFSASLSRLKPVLPLSLFSNASAAVPPLLRSRCPLFSEGSQ